MQSASSTERNLDGAACTRGPVGMWGAGKGLLSGGHRVGHGSAHAYPMKPRVPGRDRGCGEAGSVIGWGDGLCWALMDPKQQIPSVGWVGERWPGRNFPFTLLSLSPSLLIFLLPRPLLIFSLLLTSLSPAHHAARPSSSSPLCFSTPLILSVAPFSPPPAFSLFKSIQSRRSRWKNTALGTAGRKVFFFLLH